MFERLKTKYLHTGVVLALDTIVSLCASGFVLLFVTLLLPSYSFSNPQYFTWMLSSLVGSLIAFRVGRVYRGIIRYSSIRELDRFTLICLGKELLMWVGAVATGSFDSNSGLLLAMLLLDLLMTVFLLVFMRVGMIAAYDRIRTRAREERKQSRVLVYGTSDKSVATRSRLADSPRYHVEGFIVFGPKRQARSLSRLPIYYFQDENDFRRVAQQSQIDGIIFPYEKDAREEQDRLLRFCHEADIKTYITPGIDEITDDRSFCNNVRKIKIEDLLGREEIKISVEEIIDNFSGKVVLVTGAAGSIGSELCRQLAGFGVRKLILFDNAETPLHNIRLELEDSFPTLDFVPVIGDVRSLSRLDFVFSRYKPQIVFHAAAYKHVPLMEENPCEAVFVNVVGSRQVADKCVEHGVDKMVMVSTDKAVNPTNIMGCTKRMAEIYVQSLGLAIERGAKVGKTRFVTTRFGNVLGSNGSVIPRFREQIEHGGPLTVTHPEIRRFFMTIPEACRLVMEAATFATGTQIFVFDMGESVKIASLAERMITLAGLEPGRDIRIEYTGLRPGEKLYEEVLATKENTLPTQHERIFVAKVREYDLAQTDAVCTDLAELAKAVDVPGVVKLMKRTVPEYKSQNSEFEIYDRTPPLHRQEYSSISIPAYIKAVAR